MTLAFSLNTAGGVGSCKTFQHQIDACSNCLGEFPQNFNPRAYVALLFPLMIRTLCSDYVHLLNTY